MTILQPSKTVSDALLAADNQAGVALAAARKLVRELEDMIIQQHGGTI